MIGYNSDDRWTGLFGYFDDQYAMPLFYKRTVLNTTDEAWEAMRTPYGDIDHTETARWVLAPFFLIFFAISIFLLYKVIKQHRVNKLHKNLVHSEAEDVSVTRLITNENYLSDS